MRRTRLIGKQAHLSPDWRYHAFVTDRPASAVDLDAYHRDHAWVGLAVRDLKEGAGLVQPVGHLHRQRRLVRAVTRGFEERLEVRAKAWRDGTM